MISTPTVQNWQAQMPDPENITKPGSNIQSKGTSASTFAASFQAAGANPSNGPIKYGGAIPTMDAAAYDVYKQQTPVGNEQRQVPGSATPAQPQATMNGNLAGISIVPTPISQEIPPGVLPDPKDIIQPGGFIKPEGISGSANSLGAGAQPQATMNGNLAGISIIPTPIAQEIPPGVLPDPKDIIQPGGFIKPEVTSAAAYSKALQAMGAAPAGPPDWYQGAIPTMDSATYDTYKQQQSTGTESRQIAAMAAYQKNDMVL
ncbi:MAG: hypothetical protein Q9M08_00280 [Mariprofundus sp.]|nr:hypothetical protein [Mariprofundus sp.]